MHLYIVVGFDMGHWWYVRGGGGYWPKGSRLVWNIRTAVVNLFVCNLVCIFLVLHIWVPFIVCDMLVMVLIVDNGSVTLFYVTFLPVMFNLSPIKTDFCQQNVFVNINDIQNGDNWNRYTHTMYTGCTCMYMYTWCMCIHICIANRPKYYTDKYSALPKWT
jgi:membrane-associated HD superfamily phosphohydrolase